MRSLFLLPEVREAIRQTLDLDPRLPAAYAIRDLPDARALLDALGG